jgi:hypothetical protein
MPSDRKVEVVGKVGLEDLRHDWRGGVVIYCETRHAEVSDLSIFTIYLANAKVK